MTATPSPTAAQAGLESTARKHREIARRYERREMQARPARRSVVETRVRHERARERAEYIRARRIVELHRLYRARYGYVLPDNAAGRRAVTVIAHHIKDTEAIRKWTDLWAPWMSAAETDATVREVVAFPAKWKGQPLAMLLGVFDAERQRLGLRTVGAADVDAAERKRRRRAQQCQSQQRLRRARGAVPRQQYEENSASRLKPWEAFGVSRRTWERHGKPTPPGTVSQVRQHYRSFASIYRPPTCDSGPADLTGNEKKPPVSSDLAREPEPVGMAAPPSQQESLPCGDAAKKDAFDIEGGDAAAHRNAGRADPCARARRPRPADDGLAARREQSARAIFKARREKWEQRQRQREWLGRQRLAADQAADKAQAARARRALERHAEKVRDEIARACRQQRHADSMAANPYRVMTLDEIATVQGGRSQSRGRLAVTIVDERFDDRSNKPERPLARAW
jgi:hypothetical protein